MKSGLVIDAKALTKKFDSLLAVQRIDFSIQSGGCVGLLGPNGAGKSTIMRMIMGLSSITSGRLEIFGQPIESLDRATKGRIGLVPQENNFDPDLSIRENLEVFGRYFGLPKKEIKKRVPKLLRFMDLSGNCEQTVNSLSGGMRRRLIISRALINHPDLVILDEPTTGLDPQARNLIWGRLIDLKKGGCTLLLSTHYMDEAQKLCDRIIILDQGKILDHGPPNDLITRHGRKYVFEVKKPYALKGGSRNFVHDDIGSSVIYFVDNKDEFLSRLPKEANFSQRSPNLEDVFFSLTGRKLKRG